MKCKVCENGLVFKTHAHRNFSTGEVTLTLDPEACDCCGGFCEECENCNAGKRVIDWVDELPGEKKDKKET
jgi:hypothetical protein